MSVDSLSVFFPAYNEQENIKATVGKALAVLDKLNLHDYEVIVVNDGSKDKTAQIVEEMSAQNHKIKLITQNPNKGYGEALKTGLYNSKFDWITFTDSDGQFDFSEINKFFEKSSDADVVVGYRIDRKDHFIRKLNGYGWTFLANLLLGVNVRDVDCGFKLISKKVIDTIPHLESTRGAMINPELLARAKKAGFKVIEIGVHHYPRTAGSSTGANLKVIFKSFYDLFKLWWKLR